MNSIKSEIDIYKDKQAKNNSIVDQLDTIRCELLPYQQQGKITFEERIWIWSQCSKWLRKENTIYIETVKLFFIDKEIELPKFLSKFDREVTLRRINGDDSKPEKLMIEMQFDKAFMTMAYLKAVGAKVHEASVFAAITVALEFKGRAKKNLTAATIEKKYPKKFKNKSIHSNKSLEDEIKAVVENNTELKALWLSELNGLREKFVIEDLADWIVGTRR